VFRPVEAPPEVVGMPYVVFAGNVCDERTLAHVVNVLRAPGDAPVSSRGPRRGGR
jgi:hypothetical protein